MCWDEGISSKCGGSTNWDHKVLVASVGGSRCVGMKVLVASVGVVGVLG